MVAVPSGDRSTVGRAMSLIHAYAQVALMVAAVLALLGARDLFRGHSRDGLTEGLSGVGAFALAIVVGSGAFGAG